MDSGGISGMKDAPDIGKLISDWWTKTFGPKPKQEDKKEDETKK